MSSAPEKHTETPVSKEREYERSGLYPENGKAFRIWALLAWLGGTVVVLALVSAALNYLLLRG
jgi:hypothetical protein